MEQTPRFKVIYTEEAMDFLESLPPKAKGKVTYNIGKMKLYTHEEMLDRVLGEKGNPERDNYEARINSFLMGEAIKKARISKNLTQEQLGEMIGVKRAQVSRIEKGHNLTFATIARVFKAMGIAASFDMSGVGKIALW